MPLTLVDIAQSVYLVPRSVSQQVLAQTPSPSPMFNHFVLVTLCVVAAIFQAMAVAVGALVLFLAGGGQTLQCNKRRKTNQKKI